MIGRILACFFPALFLVCTSGFFLPCMAQDRAANERGEGYFKTGFYEMAPKGKAREANQYYDLAIAEFQKAIKSDDRDVAAHRNLARVYHVKGEYALSAEQYKKVTQLNPDDVDAYVNVALAYSHLHRYDDAIDQLEIAKTRTNDPAVINKLNGYIGKLEQAR